MLHDIIATVVAIAMSIGGAFGNLGNFFTSRPATPAGNVQQAQQPRPVAFGDNDPFHSHALPNPGAVLGESTSTPPAPTTIIKNYITRPIVEHAVPFPFFSVTRNDLAALEA